MIRLNDGMMQYAAISGMGDLWVNWHGKIGPMDWAIGASKHVGGNGDNGDSRIQGSSQGTQAPGGAIPMAEFEVNRNAKLGTAHPVLKGVVSITPETGALINGVPGMILENNIFVGHELTVANADARIINNVFMAEGDCTLTCSESSPISLEGAPPEVDPLERWRQPGGSTYAWERGRVKRLFFEDNRVMEAYVGWAIYRTCEGIESWSNNVASGNWMGAHAINCGSLPLEVYRNSVGVGASPRLNEVSNVEAVENGVALANHFFLQDPEDKQPTNTFKWFHGRTSWVDSTIIGRAQKTLAKRAADLANNCGEQWNGGTLSSGGKNTVYRAFGGQWDYVGIQHTSNGNPSLVPTDNTFVEVDNIHFIGFPGTDECGYRSVAMTNDPAGYGKGTSDPYRDIFSVGRITTQTSAANYGGMLCQPVFVRNLRWTDTPLEGRWQFGMGAIADQVPGSLDSRGYSRHRTFSSSVSMETAHVPAYSERVFEGSCDAPGQTRERNGRIESTCAGRDGWPQAERYHDDATDYGFSECVVYDEDGSLKEPDPEWPFARLHGPADAPQMWISAAPRQWPSLYNGHCQYTLYNPDWWDTRDEINAINRCPPIMRREPSLLLAANVPARQGISFSKPDDGTNIADWGKHGVMPQACTPLPGNGAMECNTESANDYVFLRNYIPPLYVSGSPLIYGPVFLSTCSYDGGEPIVNMVDTESWINDPNVAAGPYSCADGTEGCTLVQPQLHHVTNGGCYRIDYTGDIAQFMGGGGHTTGNTRGNNQFSFVQTEMVMRTGRHHKPRAPRNQDNDFAVVLESWFTFPGKINVYFVSAAK